MTKAELLNLLEPITDETEVYGVFRGRRYPIFSGGYDRHDEIMDVFLEGVDTEAKKVSL